MFAKISIATQVKLLNYILLFFILSLGALSLYTAHQIGSNIAILGHKTIPGLDRGAKLTSLFYRFRGDAWKHVATTNANNLDKIEASMSEIRTRFDRELADFTSLSPLAAQSGLPEAVANYWEAWERVRPISRHHDVALAIEAYMKEVDPRFRTVVDSLSRLDQQLHSDASASIAFAQATFSRARTFTLIALAAALACGIGLSLFLLQTLRRRLAITISGLATTAAELSAAANEVSSASHSLAQSASMQAASVEEVSASSEEIHSMAQQTSSHASEAESLINSKYTRFTQADQRLKLMVESMNSISEDNSRIAAALQIINGIAAQTNILALNAAVEAARAGQHGTGFAVVADEVRSLAQCCSEAAQKITTLTESSLACTTAGLQRMKEVVSDMEFLYSRSAAMKKIVHSISEAAREQGRGVSSIAQSLTSLDRQTQSTAAAAAEQSSLAATQLNAQSRSLLQSVAMLEQL